MLINGIAHAVSYHLLFIQMYFQQNISEVISSFILIYAKSCIIVAIFLDGKIQ